MNLSLLKLSLFQYFLCSHSQKYRTDSVLHNTYWAAIIQIYRHVHWKEKIYFPWTQNLLTTAHRENGIICSRGRAKRGLSNFPSILLLFSTAPTNLKFSFRAHFCGSLPRGSIRAAFCVLLVAGRWSLNDAQIHHLSILYLSLNLSKLPPWRPNRHPCRQDHGRPKWKRTSNASCLWAKNAFPRRSWRRSFWPRDGASRRIVSSRHRGLVVVVVLLCMDIREFHGNKYQPLSSFVIQWIHLLDYLSKLQHHWHISPHWILH